MTPTNNLGDRASLVSDDKIECLVDRCQQAPVITPFDREVQAELDRLKEKRTK